MYFSPVVTGAMDVALTQRRSVVVATSAVTVDEIVAIPTLSTPAWNFVSSALNAPLSQQSFASSEMGAIAREFYGLGVSSYWRHEYATAAENLAIATRADPSDARFWYYKGLSEQAIGKRTNAAESFAIATRLVVERKTDLSVLRKALERVQGPQRMVFHDAEFKLRAKLPMPPNSSPPVDSNFASVNRP